MLNQKKIDRLKRELEVAKLLADEGAKTEARETKVEAVTENAIEKIVEVEKVVEKIVEVEKLVEIEKTVEVEKIIEKVVEVEKPCFKCSESCKACEEKDKKITELEKIKEDLLSDVKYVKESYDVLNRTVDSLKKTNSEIEKAMEKMSATLMTKQSVINEYNEDCAKLKQELELEKIESEGLSDYY